MQVCTVNIVYMSPHVIACFSFPWVQQWFQSILLQKRMKDWFLFYCIFPCVPCPGFSGESTQPNPAFEPCGQWGFINPTLYQAFQVMSPRLAHQIHKRSLGHLVDVVDINGFFWMLHCTNLDWFWVSLISPKTEAPQRDPKSRIRLHARFGVLSPHLTRHNSFMKRFVNYKSKQRKYMTWPHTG